VVTLRGAAPRLRDALADTAVIPSGVVAARDGVLVFVGGRQEFERHVTLLPRAVVLDALGGTVLPGFVDPHTHLPFAGWREREYELKIAGESYETMSRGGGIRATVQATRRAQEDELKALVLERLDALLLHGTTTVEAKSGYGLTLEDELKQLRALRAAAERHAVTVVPTLLGAHVVPAEAREDRDAYVRLVCEEMIPAAAQQGLARFCDVFVDAGAFTLVEAERILLAARASGLGLRVHAEQRQAGGAASLAARLGAASADHLEHLDQDGALALARAGTAAVLLPGAAFFLRDPRDPPARRLIEMGAAVALATDFNPGTCPAFAMGAILNLACLRYGLVPAEAIAAATINAAHSLGLAATTGSLEIGKQADLQVAAVPNHSHLAYRFGSNQTLTVVKRGRVVVENGRLTPAARGK
jgi:imidazolonepropionase